MTFILEGKTALITGASSGFGEAMARMLAHEGVNLVLGARRLKRLTALKEELEPLGVSIWVDDVDVTSRKDVDRFCQWALEQASQVDILINNAGKALGKEPVESADESDWVEMFQTNTMGVFRMIQNILPAMKAQGHGHILNIGSTAGHEAYPGGAGYCGSKFALKAMTQAMRRELLGTGIRIGLLDPGMAETEFSNVRFKGDDDKAYKTYKGMTPLSAQDVAGIACFMLRQPKHVNIDDIIVTPTDQATATDVFRRM